MAAAGGCLPDQLAAAASLDFLACRGLRSWIRGARHLHFRFIFHGLLRLRSSRPRAHRRAPDLRVPGPPQDGYEYDVDGRLISISAWERSWKICRTDLMRRLR